ncbi:hypothetical protein MEBOL_001232 [Melittangium boletus DSM 14713]|uniref:Uncharacterized protein n=1 Tax=Melittangium boletus DSM 14713 TaxID=1294270 RepID=A0A250I9I1_9BACT|nr:hypothetical protein MEBOL_001232 [Melittangium boletus DSM 14713]
MRYDLLLQSLTPGAPFDSARVESLLVARGAKARPEGGHLWQLDFGAVEVHPLREGGQWIATEVRVPLSDRADLLREVVTKGLALASEAEVRFFDPQLGRELSKREEDAVAEQYLRTARYASDTLGMAEAMPMPAATETEGFQPTTKFALGVVAFFVLLYLLVNWMGDQLAGG